MEMVVNNVVAICYFAGGVHATVRETTKTFCDGDDCATVIKCDVLFAS